MGLWRIAGLLAVIGLVCSVPAFKAKRSTPIRPGSEVAGERASKVVDPDPTPAVLTKTVAPTPSDRWDRLRDRAGVRRLREVHIDVQPLHTLLRTGRSSGLVLDLFEGVSLQVRFDRVDRSEGGGILYGRVIGRELSEVTAVVSGTRASVSIRIPGKGSYWILPSDESDGAHMVADIDDATLPPCGGVATAESSKEMAPADSEAAATPTTPAVIDLMIVYTPYMKQLYGGTAGIEAATDLALADANRCYQGSQANVRLRLVYRGEFAYTENGDAQTALNVLQSADDIRSLRSKVGADLVCLIARSQVNGLGYLMPSPWSGWSNFGFSVVSSLEGTHALAHEIGHNLGSQHDRPNVLPSQRPYYPYAYGYRTPDNVLRTVMAYSPGARISYFSSPSIVLNGVPLGVANSEDNVRSLNNMAPFVAEYFPTTTVTASAGPDQLVVDSDGDGREMVLLDGTGSDGPGMLACEWRENGALLATGLHPSIWMAPGVHVVDLTVWNGADTASDRIVIRLREGPAVRVPSEYSTIQAAIDSVPNGTTILVAPGTYSGIGNRNLLCRAKAVRLLSEEGPESTILDCQGVFNAARAISFEEGEGAASVFEGFTVINGYHPETGGAIFCVRSSPVIRNCIFVGNRAPNGGAMSITGGSPLIEGCTFTQNELSETDRCGGAIECQSGNPIIRSCTFRGNRAWGGGAFHSLPGSTPRLENCTFSGNVATYGGGAVLVEFSQTLILNCTFFGNQAPNGAGLYGYYGSLTVANTVAWGAGVIYLQQAALDARFSILPRGFNGEGVLHVAPIFVDTKSGNYRLAAKSPGLDAADGDLAPATDADGFPRADLPEVENHGTGIPNYADMGAFERQVPVVPYK